MIQIFIALKIHRSKPDLNPQTLIPVASTITITPLRMTTFHYMFVLSSIQGTSSTVAATIK
jgi:hypothetical protein